MCYSIEYHLVPTEIKVASDLQSTVYTGERFYKSSDLVHTSRDVKVDDSNTLPS